jgi:hypothetical protein
MSKKELHEMDQAELDAMLEQEEQGHGDDAPPAETDDETPPEKEDETSVETEEETPPDSRDKRGLIKDLQSERARARLLREEAEALRLELDAMKRGKKAESEPEPEPEPVEDPEELLTRAEVKALLEKERAALKQADIERMAKAKTENAKKCVAKAEKELTADKTGVGLDYKTVANLGKDSLRKGDFEEIQESEDPARTFYELCLLRNPELRKRQQIREREKLLKETRGGGRVTLPKGGSGSGKAESVLEVVTGGGQDPEYESLLGKSQKELLEMLGEDE